MKRTTFAIFFTLTLLFCGQRANAQWELFADLLGQLSDGENNQFFNNLNGLGNNPDIDLSDLNNNLDGLFDAMGNPLPAGMLDTFGISGGLIDLETILQNSGLPGSDQDTILGELGRLNDLLNMNFDSLNNLFGQYQDSLGNDPNWDVHVIDYNDLSTNHLGILQDTLNTIIGPGFPNNPGDVADIIGKLFNAALFADLELAFGVQNSDFKYWDDRYFASAKVLRVGTVPSFNKTVIDCHDGILRLPIEPRWHVETSWLSGRMPTTINNGSRPAGGGDSGTRGSGGNLIQARDGEGSFNPLLLFGDFAMMATPNVGRIGSTSFHLITSLGIEFGTYAPAHREYYPIRTANNRGFATGFGPQVGSGFSAVNGPLVIYSMGTVVARGDVFHCDLPYKYNSMRLEAGIRYGDIINVRYTTGKISWQENDNRRATINHQFTVGIILSGLHH